MIEDQIAMKYYSNSNTTKLTRGHSKGERGGTAFRIIIFTVHMHGE